MKYKKALLNDKNSIEPMSKKDALLSGATDGVINLIYNVPKVLLLLLILSICIYFICKG
jgi:hypothetical protein